jgi:carbon monoxide dehydrogenase subunit G
MKIEGHFIFPAPAQEVWDLLTDPQSLQHCTPGCKQLTEIATDEFEATMEVGIGPIKGIFHGKISMKDKAPPRSYKLIIEGSGAAGFVRGEGALTLQEEAGDQTAVHVAGDGQVGGVMAGVGQRLFEGVAKQLMGQFFQCMQGRLAARRENPSV